MHPSTVRRQEFAITQPPLGGGRATHRRAFAADSSKRAPEPRLIAESVSPDGGTTTKELNDAVGQVTVELGPVVRLAVDPACAGCSAKITKLLQDREEKEFWKEKPLPIALNGDKLAVFSIGTVVVTVELTRIDSTKVTGDYVILYDMPKRWWAVADTVAYAVTRRQGNTAIAGAGVFLDFPHWWILKRTNGFIRWSVVVHLLPPAGKDEPADVGIAPLAIALFGNRVVAGIGWNISRQGLRPTENNRYVYIGFSASQLLNPTR